jgi:hypothetical protein
MSLLPVYELPSSKYHYPLATMIANLAKLTPERPALIPLDDDRQAHEAGLNNLGIQCQRASKAVVIHRLFDAPRILVVTNATHLFTGPHILLTAYIVGKGSIHD